MNMRRLQIWLTAALLVAAGVLVGCATTTTTPAPLELTSAAKARTSPDCLTSGTHIRLQPGQCAASTGRVYTRDDLDRTAAFDMGEALRLMDPTIFY